MCPSSAAQLCALTLAVHHCTSWRCIIALQHFGTILLHVKPLDEDQGDLQLPSCLGPVKGQGNEPCTIYICG